MVEKRHDVRRIPIGLYDRDRSFHHQTLHRADRNEYVYWRVLARCNTQMVS